MSRLNTLKDWLRAASLWPTFPDEERTQKARTFHGVAWWTLVITSFFLLVMASQQPNTIARRMNTIATMTAFFVALLWLNKRGHTRLASWSLVLGQTAIVTVRAYTSGGATAPALSLFVYLCMIAGTLLGTLGGVVSALLLAGIGLGLALLGDAGLLPPPELSFSPMVGWFYSCMALSLSALLHPQITRALASSLARAQAEIAARTLADEHRVQVVHALGERVKELRLLHAVARLVQQPAVTDDALFAELVRGIPLAWQFPETCEARITYRDLEVTTPGFRDSPWRQSKPFETTDGSGLIEVVYLDARPDSDEGPFLDEERALLDSLAELLVGHLELRKHQQHLEQLVSTRTQEMQRAKEEAERASGAKTTFLATMSHEIRTPMNAILGYAQLLRRDPQLGPTQQARLDTILASGEHLLTLINDVLEMSKIEAGSARLAPEAVDLPQLLEGIKQMFAAQARAKGLSLSFELPPELPRLVEADPGKLRQVVINLLSNALKFTAQGGVSLGATVERQTDTAYALRIVVNDTGTGIEAADLERIFDTFEQTGAGARGGGTGLGLSIGRSLARLMGGDLTAESRVGVGSAFTFRFEAGTVSSEVSALGLRARVTGLASGQRRPRVLVVDDVPDNVDLAVSLLRTVGFEAQGAPSGESGIALHDTWQPELVLMDLRMPGMGGLEAIRHLRAAGANTVLVAFTASGFEELTNAALAMGADDVVFKPYRETQLLETIAGLLHLELSYEADAQPAAPSLASLASLAALLRGVPAALRLQLREAVLQARPQRVEALAEELGALSMDAASQVRELVRDFRYDELASALEAADVPEPSSSER